VRRSAALLAVPFLALACGKYGAPLRASEAAEPAKKPGLGLKLPPASKGAEPSPSQPAPPPTAPETEPPPEGEP
jgi:hypothetical protein